MIVLKKQLLFFSGYSGDWRESRGGGEVGSKQSLGQISGVSDNPEKYRDIAL